MHVIALKKLKTFYQNHSDAKKGLLSWYSLICDSQFASFEQLKEAFPQVDYVKPFHVFNVGRAYRLIAAIHFNRQKVYVRHILTHEEYERGKWKVK